MPQLVSIILPVYNGARYLPEALDSILDQTYTSFELIAVNDGSEDQTGDILEAYQQRDGRISVITQENRQLPGALSAGFWQANGEFLTWTGVDNRWRSTYLARYVEELQQLPHVDLLYGNLALIGEDGRALVNSTHYIEFQKFVGSADVMLPKQPVGLNIETNYLGGAFLYRARVPAVIGSYDPNWLYVEDYDYWMRVNALLTIQHTSFDDCLYEYRYHGASLSARASSLRVSERTARLVAFDMWRRTVYLSALAWNIHCNSDATAMQQLSQDLYTLVHHQARQESIPWQVSVCIGAAEQVLPEGDFRVLILEHSQADVDTAEWDLCIAYDDQAHSWMATRDIRTLFTVIDIRAKLAYLALKPYS